MCKWECGRAVEQDQETYVRYYEQFSLESQEKSKKAMDDRKYLESICDKIIDFQRMGSYNLMYAKTKELGWKGNQDIQNTGIKDSQGNIIIDQR